MDDQIPRPRECLPRPDETFDEFIERCNNDVAMLAEFEAPELRDLVCRLYFHLHRKQESSGQNAHTEPEE